MGSPLPHKHQVAGAPPPPTLLAVYMPADIPVEGDIHDTSTQKVEG